MIFFAGMAGANGLYLISSCLGWLRIGMKLDFPGTSCQCTLRIGMKLGFPVTSCHRNLRIGMKLGFPGTSCHCTFHHPKKPPQPESCGGFINSNSIYSQKSFYKFFWFQSGPTLILESYT